ncbi:MAG TPA: sugar transferase [Thermoleophilaceae bacterium]|nr:sugar transferase [Thermoleophilaceae bacterium]
MAGTTFLAVMLLLFAVAELPSPEQAPTIEDAFVVAALGLGLWVIGSIGVHVPSSTAWAQGGDARAQSIFSRIARHLAPATAAAALALSHGGRPGDALAVFICMLGASLAFSSTRYPLHLSGLARFFFDLLTPVAGIALAFLVGELLRAQLAFEAWLVPLLGAWLIAFVGGWLEEAFNAERPIRLAVMGEPGLASALAHEMTTTGVRDHVILGWIADETDVLHEAGPEVGNGRPMPRLGTISEIRSVVLEQEIDVLVMPPRNSGGDLFQETIESCIDLPVSMLPAARLYEDMHGRVPIGAISAAWFAYLMHPNFSPQSGWSKRALDIAVAGPLCLMLAPLMAIVALAVKLQDRGPVLFRQRRAGAGGVDFEVLKFRSMGVNAEVAGQPQWAQAADPRVTTVGRILRASHLDEMPQLINVLRGDMSLVGPRPERPEFVAELERTIPYYSRRVLVKPGITGWAQVRSGYAGSELGTAFKLCHDLYYIKHRSMLFDLLTLVETVRTLVADRQYEAFTFSEAFIVKPGDVADEAAAALGKAPVLGDVASLAEDTRKLQQDTSAPRHDTRAATA